MGLGIPIGCVEDSLFGHNPTNTDDENYELGQPVWRVVPSMCDFECHFSMHGAVRCLVDCSKGFLPLEGGDRGVEVFFPFKHCVGTLKFVFVLEHIVKNGNSSVH